MNRLISRNDTRIELTRVLKEATDYFSDTTPIGYATTRKRGTILSIYRNIDDAGQTIPVNGLKELNSNTDSRVFFTPPTDQKKRIFNVKITRKYIHIS